MWRASKSALWKRAGLPLMERAGGASLTGEQLHQQQTTQRRKSKADWLPNVYSSCNIQATA